MSVRTVVEGRRGCGYRKPGGLYMVAPAPNEACTLLPVEMTVCPCCGAGIRPARGWTWIRADDLLNPRPHDSLEHQFVCPLAAPGKMGDRQGLIWIGEGFYKSPESFLEEARRLGISRRVTGVPRGFKIGETWVLLAHRRAIRAGFMSQMFEEPFDSLEAAADAGADMEKLLELWKPGIFSLFRPTAVEYVCRDDDLEDEEFLETIRKRGLDPVHVLREEQTAIEEAA